MQGYWSRFLGLLAAAALCACGSDAEPPPLLTALEVGGVKTSLNPPFDPSISRYSVIADDGLQGVTIEARASRQTFVTINGQISATGTPTPIAALSPGDVIEVDVHTYRRSHEPKKYEIVYLPPDFPELRVSLHTPEASTEPLYVTLNGRGAKYLAILDNNGVPLFYRAEDQPVFDFKRQAATGERSYLRYTGTRNQWGRRNGEAVVLDASFNEVERITTVGLSHTDIHDFLITPNNEMILIAYEGRLEDLTYLGLTAEELVEESVVQVLDRATRQVMFQWSSWEHLPYEDQTYPRLRGEYAHVNSVVEDLDGNLIISASGTSQAVKIARPSGQTIWKLGGKSNQFRLLNDPLSHFCGQHTVSRLESRDLLIFDNGRNCWSADENRALTRVIEYRLDEQTLEAELVWSYSQGGTVSTSQGSAQRLVNGNTLIGWGAGPGILATEVNSLGEKVFEITAYDGERPVVSYRAQKYPE
jgi:hypothetical protein